MTLDTLTKLQGDARELSREEKLEEILQKYSSENLPEDFEREVREVLYGVHDEEFQSDVEDTPLVFMSFSKDDVECVKDYITMCFNYNLKCHVTSSDTDYTVIHFFKEKITLTKAYSSVSYILEGSEFTISRYLYVSIPTG